MKSARSRILALVLVLTMIFCTGCETGASSGVASQSTASGSASEANSESAPAEEGNRDVVVAIMPMKKALIRTTRFCGTPMRL